jgi:uncharacterized membrane-anchored protein YjiN (DUF445 family)
MQRWLTGRVGSGPRRMLRLARDPDAALTGQLGEALRQLGETLQGDEMRLAERSTASSAAPRSARSDYGDGIVRLVSDTVRGWDARTITRRLENAVGRDLQYIRINGTLVGGLVGVAIHARGSLLLPRARARRCL